MAHQTNINQVKINLQSSQSSESDERVMDPTCGMKMNRKDSKHVLFRQDDTFYFCSKACLDGFVSPKSKEKAA